MTLALALLLLLPSPVGNAESYRILFLGNSHTANNDLAGMVSSLLRSAGHTCETQFFFGAFLDDLEPRRDVREAIDRGRYTHVVLQGAKLSSSHKYDYPKESGIALVERIKRAGAEPLLFAEWPRRGWDEAAYILGEYGKITAKASCPIVPVPQAWTAATKSDPSADLWASDGNHARPLGTYLAACTIAFWIAGDKAELTYTPPGTDVKLATRVRQLAQRAVAAQERRMEP